MRRRTFCKTTLAAGVAASLNTSAAVAAFNGMTQVISNVAAVTSVGEEISIEMAALNELGSSLAGTLLLPGDSNYESARRVWNGMIDKHPAMIALCGNSQDVSNAITFARERNLLVAVKGGGHSYPGKSSCDGGMVIDLSPMHSVDVAVEKRTMRAGGGALLANLDTAAIAINHITTTGVVSHTGVGGFTLGGGLGRVDRQFGLAVDNLLAATLVTVDGQIRSISNDENLDLFWAIRGGGGNFGVATEFVYRIHPFNPTPYGGTYTYPLSQAKDLMHFLAEFFEKLPDECNLEPGLGVTPDGERFIRVTACYSGDYAEGEKLLAPLSAFGTPSSGQFAPFSYQQLQTGADGYFAHGQQNYLKSGFLPEITSGFIDAMIDNYDGEFLPDTWFQHLGGATSRIDPQATAFVHRNAHSNYGISSVWKDPAESEQRIANVRRYYAAIKPYMSGFYTNLHADTKQKTWSNYGVNYPRLAKVKNEYDPSNFFHLNSNILPTV